MFMLGLFSLDGVVIWVFWLFSLVVSRLIFFSVVGMLLSCLVSVYVVLLLECISSLCSSWLMV